MRQKQCQDKEGMVHPLWFWRSNNRTGLMRTLLHAPPTLESMALSFLCTPREGPCFQGALSFTVSPLSYLQGKLRKVWFQILLEGLFKNTSPASSASFSGYPPLPGPSGCVLHPVQLWRFQIFTPLIFLVIFQLLRLFLFYFLIAHIHLLGLAGGFLSLKN